VSRDEEMLAEAAGGEGGKIKMKKKKKKRKKERRAYREYKGRDEERAPKRRKRGKEDRGSTKEDWCLSQRGFEHFQEEFVHGYARAAPYHRPEATQRTIDLPDARHTQQQVLHLTRPTALPEGAGAITEGGEDALSELFDVGHTLDAYVAVDKHQSFE